jgi:hypothetical protein
LVRVLAMAVTPAHTSADRAELDGYPERACMKCNNYPDYRSFCAAPELG